MQNILITYSMVMGILEILLTIQMQDVPQMVHSSRPYRGTAGDGGESSGIGGGNNPGNPGKIVVVLGSSATLHKLIGMQT